MYLIVFEGGDFRLSDEISEDDKRMSQYGVITIFNLEDKTFHVEKDTWQQIVKR